MKNATTSLRLPLPVAIGFTLAIGCGGGDDWGGADGQRADGVAGIDLVCVFPLEAPEEGYGETERYFVLEDAELVFENLEGARYSSTLHEVREDGRLGWGFDATYSFAVVEGEAGHLPGSDTPELPLMRATDILEFTMLFCEGEQFGQPFEAGAAELRAGRESYRYTTADFHFSRGTSGHCRGDLEAYEALHQIGRDMGLYDCDPYDGYDGPGRDDGEDGAPDPERSIVAKGELMLGEPAVARFEPLAEHPNTLHAYTFELADQARIRIDLDSDRPGVVELYRSPGGATGDDASPLGEHLASGTDTDHVEGSIELVAPGAGSYVVLVGPQDGWTATDYDLVVMPRERGVVSFLNAESGYGFIQPDARGEEFEVFLNHHQYRGDWDALGEGAAVEYFLRDEVGRPKAFGVEAL